MPHGCSVCASKHSLWPIKVKQASRGQFVFKVFAIPVPLYYTGKSKPIGRCATPDFFIWPARSRAFYLRASRISQQLTIITFFERFVNRQIEQKFSRNFVMFTSPR